jgi:hypothetical protein
MKEFANKDEGSVFDSHQFRVRVCSFCWCTVDGVFVGREVL